MVGETKPELGVGLILKLLEAESEPLRFERFACGLLSRREGGHLILTTSSNYDRGRDGVTSGSSPPILVLIGTGDSFGKKAQNDAAKAGKFLRKGTKFAAAYFCSTQRFTEKRADEIVNDMHRHIPTTRAEALSAGKLAQLAHEHEDLVWKHYPGEIRTHQASAAAGPPSTERESALRLAVATAGCDSVGAIREAVWQTAIRGALRRRPATTAELCVALSNELHLSAQIGVEVASPHLELLLDDGAVEQLNGRWQLTARGIASATDDEQRVEASTTTGRKSFKLAIEKVLQTSLDDTQTSRMWEAVYTAMATLFYERGREVLAFVGALTGTVDQSANVHNANTVAGDEPSLHSGIVVPIANAVASVFEHKETREEIRTAINDLLTSGDGPVVSWLSSVCFGYICACSMGLEAKTRAALSELVLRTSLVLDTDAVLSLLCADEPQHEAMTAIHRRWKDLGGRLLLAESVLKEVAHHAWIADNDWRSVASLWPATAEDRSVLSRNAFVRGFGRELERKHAKHAHWSKWIGNYRGKSAADATAARGSLRSTYGLGELAAPSGKYKQIAISADEYIQKRIAKNSWTRPYDERDEFIKRDKAVRDGELFASIVQRAEHGIEHGDGDVCYLLTSSGRFRDLAKHLHEHSLNVLSIAAAAYLLSMIPGRDLGLASLRIFLVEGSWRARLGQFDEHVLRVVKRSEEYSFPIHKRPTLQRELRAAVESEARERSRRQGGKANTGQRRAVENEWMDDTGGPKDAFATALARALDVAGADHRRELEVAAKDARIKELEREVAALKVKGG